MNDLSIALMEAAAWLMHREDWREWRVDIQSYDCTATIQQWIYEDYGDDGNSAVENMAAKRRAIGGQWQKETTNYEFALTQSVSDNLTIKLSVSRDAACTPRVVGQETVEVSDYSNCPKKMETRDIVEWDCNPILESA